MANIALSGSALPSNSKEKFPLEKIDINIIDMILKETYKNNSILNNEYLYKLKLELKGIGIASSLNLDFDLLKGNLPPIEKYLFENIITIDLDSIIIREEDVEVLNLVLKYGNVSSIILRNITFSTVRVEYKFLNYLEKNTQIEILILRNIGITYKDGIIIIEKLLHIIGMLNNITFLEFSGFKFSKIQDLANYTDLLNTLFYETLIKLEKLEFLIFNDNYISHRLYYNIFNKHQNIPITIIGNELTINDGVMNIKGLKNGNKRTLQYYTKKNYTFSLGRIEALANYGINRERINTEMKKIQTKLNIDNLYFNNRYRRTIHQ